MMDRSKLENTAVVGLQKRLQQEAATWVEMQLTLDVLAKADVNIHMETFDVPLENWRHIKIKILAESGHYTRVEEFTDYQAANQWLCDFVADLELM